MSPDWGGEMELTGKTAFVTGVGILNTGVKL